MIRKSHDKEMQTCATVGGLWICLFVDAHVHLLLFSQFLIISIKIFGEIADRVYHDLHRDVHQKYAPTVSPKEKGKLKHMTSKKASRILPTFFRNIAINMSHWHRVIEVLWNGHFQKVLFYMVSIFPSFICVYHLHVVSREVRRGSQILWNWS